MRTGTAILATLIGLCCGMGAPQVATVTTAFVFVLLFFLERDIIYQIVIMSDDPEGDKNKIDQQLSKLNTFCGGQFREYCFTKWFDKGLGLKTSFADEYFLFER